MSFKGRPQLAESLGPLLCDGVVRGLLLLCLAAGLLASVALGQSAGPTGAAALDRSAARSALSPAYAGRARVFLGGRQATANTSVAAAMQAARRQHLALLGRPEAQSGSAQLGAAWQPVGPNQIASLSYGEVTGRVTAIAIDPADATGNTVYVGTTGGGVWKSTNAAGPAASVTFAPLTDTLPVFSANAGTSAIPSLSIGAISVHSGVVLAGTGDPNDALDSYYGSGLLRSADNGVTWTLIQESQDGAAGHHSFTGLGFAGFAWSDATPNLVVAALSQAAEGVLVNAVNVGNSVMGLYYSTDAGVTWQMSTIMDGSQVVQSASQPGGAVEGRAATAVVWNPVRRMFYAVVRYHGYYGSPDGVTWTRLANQPGAGLSLSACPTEAISAGLTTCPVFRGALAVQATTGDTFALTVDGNNVDQGLWQDVCSPAGNCSGGAISFGKQLASSPLEVGGGSSAIAQADYNLALSAVPSGASGSTQDTLLFVGTVDLFRCSLSAGCTLRNTTNALNGCAAPAKVAPAQHAIASMADAALPLVYLGNDGGLWRSTDGVNQQAGACSSDDANHFQNLNPGIGSLAEVVSIAQSATDAGTLLAGLGANGTAGIAGGTLGAPWPQLSAAEGGTVAIDPTNPLQWYISTGAGVEIRQCANGGACTSADFSGPATIGPAQVSGDDSLIDAPWLLDPALPSDVLIGTCRVWRGPAADGAAWSGANAISTLLAGPRNAACGSANPVLRSLAAGGVASSATAAQNAGSAVLYAGMAGAADGGENAGGHVFSLTTGSTANSTTAWTDQTASPVTNAPDGFNPGGFDISSLAADAHDATGATVYATVMGFAGNGLNVAHVYRSVSGGASWTNISSNLPNASANSVVVDPNDANTVYVALDTGVYVTNNVTSCASANCWGVYGISLPNSPVMQLAAAAAMPTGDGRVGELRAATYGRGVWQIPLLTASAGSQAAITLTPAALVFATQSIGAASAPQTIVVTNTGSSALTVTSLSTTGDFIETDTCAGTSLPAGANCSIQMSFLPKLAGAETGVLTVYGNVPGGQATATLAGTGSAAAPIVLNPVTLSFPTTTVNATSPAQNITISNTSSTTIALRTPAVTGTDFKLTANTCGPTLAPSTGCTVALAFTPAASGARSGIFTITDDAGTQTASLSGIGTSPPTDALTPLTLTFGQQQIDTASASQQVVLTNSGDQPLTLIAAQIASGDFTAVNACGNSLNGHSSCSISVSFAPKDLGVLAGVLTVSDEYRSQSIALNGFGLAPLGVSLAPFGAVSFAATGLGVTSAGQTVTLTNNGTVPLQVQNAAVTGDFAIVPGSNTCGSTLAVGSACTMQVVFAPSAGGPRSGSLTVTDSAPNSPQTLALTGSGVDFTLTSNGPSSVMISSGQNAVFPLLLSSAANVSGVVSFTCTGMPANSTCTVVPNNVALGNTTTISVTVLTGVSATTAGLRPLRRERPWMWLTMLAPLAPLGLFGAKKRGLPRLASVVVLGSLLTALGCGAGRTIPAASGLNPNPTSGLATPSGTYAVVASASCAGLARPVTLTLTVQ